MARGGFREGSGRKKLPIERKRLPRVFYLNVEEYNKVKEFEKCLKQKKN